MGNSLANNLLRLVIIVFVVGVCTAFVLAHYEIGLSIDSPNYIALLSTNATFIAAILAVAFSISIFIIQHAASNYVPSLLNVYLRDRNTWASFLLLSISTALNVFGLATPPTKLMVNLSLFSAAYSFGLLAFHFYYVTHTASPSTMIQKIESDARKYIRNLPYRARELALDEIKSSAQVNRVAKEIGPELIIQAAFHRDDLHEPTKLVVRQVLDFVQKALAKREIETAEMGLRSISNLIAEYVQVRSKDFSPEDKFISAILEQLQSLSVIAIDNKDIFTLRALSNAYREIGISTTRISLIGGAQTSHESTNLVLYYLQTIASTAVERGLHDGAAETIRSIRDVGVIAINQSGADALAIHRLVEICTIAIPKGDWYIPREVCNSLSILISTAMDTGLNHVRIGLDLERVSKIINKIIMTLSQEAELILLPFFGPKNRTQFNYSTSMMVARVLKQKNGQFPKTETRFREEFVRNVIEDIVKMVCTAGDTASRNHDALLCLDITESLFEIALFCIRERFITFPEELEDCAKSAILSMFSVYNAFVKSNAGIVSVIRDDLVLLALEAINSNRTAVVSRVIKIMSDISIRISTDKEHEAKYLASNVLMIGLYAADKGNADLAQNALTEIQRYERNAAYHEDFEKVVSIDDVKNTIMQHYDILELRPTPEKFLKENLSTEAWEKFNKLKA